MSRLTQQALESPKEVDARIIARRWKKLYNDECSSHESHQKNEANVNALEHVVLTDNVQ